MKTFRFTSPALVFVLITFCATRLLDAQDFKGADSVLQAVAEQSGKKKPKKENERAKLTSDLENFGKSAPTLSAEAAAKQWLELATRLLTMPAMARMDGETGERISAEQLLAALPPPTSWDSLAKEINARPTAKKGSELQEAGLRLLAAALTGDKAGRDKELQALQASGEKASRSEAHVYSSVFQILNESLLESSDDPEAMLKMLERRMARDRGQRGPQSLRLPNLVALVGEERAEVFLRNALTNYNVTLTIEDSNATSALARKVALQVIEQLKAPQWALVNSLDSLQLFEALDKKFAKPAKPVAPVIPALPDGLDFMPDMGSGDHLRTQAETYYLLGLISAGRPKEAVAVAERVAKNGNVYLPHEALAAMERAGFVTALDDFFFELLTKDSSLSYWNEYVQLAAKAGSTERMMKLARAAANDENVPKGKRASIHQNLFRALLADGQVDEGAAEIKRLLAIDAPTSRMEMGRGSLGLMLAKLGVLLKRPEWTEEGIRAARASLTNSQDNASSWMDENVSSSLAHLLLDLKRGAEAEAVLTEALTDAARKFEARGENSFGEESKAAGLLASLASLYHGANRPADVVTLLDNAPYWGAQDLADLFESGIGMDMDAAYFAMRMHVRSAEKSYPLPYVAAASFATLGRNAEARAVNRAVLDAQPGYDRAYELALKLDGDSAVAHMDELFSRDQFEERPLIWKARLLADKKDFAAAEEVVRRAIAIDPSDGEQGPGDRMRGYAVLADIREARGDQKEATFFHGVVKAIRLSEDADQFYAAGLLKRAVAMYQESLKSFADAYCIQSRLAIQLAELGMHEQAEEHYRRAYELMPDSFGRVESHCFGCEKAFAGARAQTLAEKIFTELAAKQPNKPQVHYLLGYLREEQERHADAVPHFRKAVQLDPEYLNAWQKLLGASSHVRMPASERDQIVFNLLRLDPLRRHISVGWQHVSDLKGLWAALDAANKKQPQKPQSLYPLAASKARLEKNETAQGRRFDRMQFSRMYRNANQSPGAALAQTPYVQAALQLLNYVNYEEQ